MSPGGNSATEAPPDDFTFFDAHLHYEKIDSDFLSPDELIHLLDQNGASHALVSSLPNANTLKLYEIIPDRIVPFLRPFEKWSEKWKWQYDPKVRAPLQAVLQSGIYHGIGEFNLRPKHVTEPGVDAIATLATELNLLLHVEVNETGLKELLKRYPQVRIIWAHAGRRSSAQAVRSILESSRSVWVDLAQRFDVAPHGKLSSEWSALFQSHPERFFVGSGSSERRILRKLLRRSLHPGSWLKTIAAPRAAWNAARWATLEDSLGASRQWLQQLPEDIAIKIAYENASDLFEISPHSPNE